MSKFNEKKVMPRYSLICMLLTLVALAVLIKAYIMTAQRSYWEQVAKRETRDSVPVPSQRGNIHSDDGQLLASSLRMFPRCEGTGTLSRVSRLATCSQ